MKKKLTFFSIICIFAILVTPAQAFFLDPGPGDPDPPPEDPLPPPPPANTGPITVTIAMPSFSVVGSQISVSFNTLSTADRVELSVDGVLKRTWSNTKSGSYSFTASNEITHHVVRVFAYNSRYEGVHTKRVCLQYPLPSDPELQEWLTNSSDYARSFSPSNSIYHKQVVWDAVYEALLYADTHSPLNNVFSDTSQSIYALMQFAEDVLQPQYGGSNSQSDCLSAFDMGIYFSSFDGTASNAADFVAPGRIVEHEHYNESGFDCADFASFISGMALALNIPSRMVSLHDDRAECRPSPELGIYSHMFAEVWGIEINGNQGWFLIDPGHTDGEGGFVSSHTTLATVKDMYTQEDGELRIICFMWGMDSTEWGQYSDEPTTCWSNDTLANQCKIYTGNPWSLVSGPLTGEW